MSLQAVAAQTGESDTSLDALVLQELELFGKAVAKFGIPFSLVSKSGLERLREVPSQRKSDVIGFLRNWRDWISVDSEVDAKPTYSELTTLRKALDHYGLEAHEDFWKTIKPNQFVEFYNPEMIQIYRSLSFLGISCYSVLDLMTTEWYVLWERPKRVTDQLLKTADTYANSYIPVQKFDVAKHLLREVYNTGLTEPFIPRATVVEFQHIGTLLDVKTRQPAGFICTSTGHIVANGKEAESLDFV